MSKIRIYDGGYSDEQRKTDQATAKEKLEQEQAQKDAKESAKAKLAALGLSEDEVNAIIGGI
jgi:F0F1-type ATP synthase assembly protein I